ncbi:unnamed protein product, partial [Ixodes persulcatus]
ISEHKEDPNTSFNMSNLIGNALTVFAAGSQTTSTTILWSLLSLADNADTVQRKVQEEVDRVTGGRRVPAWSDRHAMSYTMATVLEMYRWRTIVVMGMPRELLQKFTVLPEDGKTVDLNYDTEGFCMPKPQNLRFIPR